MSELGDRLKELRAKAIKGGMQLLSVEEINAQLSGCEELYARAERAEQEAASLRVELDKTKDLLRDPNVVHANMLRGIVAPITLDQCAHVHGAEAVESLHRLRADAERYRWLRKDSAPSIRPVAVLCDEDAQPTQVCLFDGELDAAIDAARQNAEKK